MPELPAGISHGHGLHDQPDWKLSVGYSRQNLKGIQRRGSRDGRKADLNNAILFRGNITKHAFIGYVLPKRIHVDIECLQYRFSINRYVEGTRFIGSCWSRKVQMHFVDTGLE